MLLRRIIVHLRNQEWTAIGIDFLVVVMGVVMGIQVANWNDDRLDRRRETVYLVALQGDFRTIVAELERDIARYGAFATSMTFLLEQSRLAEPSASLEALNEAAAQLKNLEATPIASHTYSNLTGSGDLAIIESQELKRAMSSFFGWYEVIRLVADTHEMQLVGVFQPYIIKNLDYVGMLSPAGGMTPSAAFDPDRVLAVLPTAEFRNVVAVKWDIVSDLRGLLIFALEKARVIEAMLAEELSARP